MQNANDLRKYPQPLADLVKKSQDRLNNKYQNLRNNKKNCNKAKVAVARELCGYIWELEVKVFQQIGTEFFTKAA
jgi:hypothetical protein